MIWLPSCGSVLAGQAKKWREPHKLGRVMWDRTIVGNLVPFDLHGRIMMKDEENLNHVAELMLHCKKVTPVLHLIRSKEWSLRIDIIKPYLMASLDTRAEARMLRMGNDWFHFWNSIK